MHVLSDDFAAVGIRENYANLSLPKEANSEVLLQADNGPEEISCKK